MKCPNNHELEEFKAPSNSYTCDVCLIRIVKDHKAYGCR